MPMERLDAKDLLKIDQNWLEPQAGRILVSEPYSSDHIFEKSVVLIAEHNEKGTLGFILNKPIMIEANPLLKFFGVFPPNISLGGPLGLNCVISLHSLGPDIIPESKPVSDGIFYGGSYKEILRKIEDGLVSEHDVRFFLGYSSWAPKQLDKEIESKFWIVGNLDRKTIMDYDSDIWAEAVKNLGGHYTMWQNLPSNPIYN